MFQDIEVGFRELMLSWRTSTLLWWTFTIRFWARYLLSKHQRHFSGHVLDSCWALKSYLRIALPSTTCFFHMQSPYRVSMSPFMYNCRADRIPLSAPLSAQGLSYWAPADPLIPSGCSSPEHSFGAENPFWWLSPLHPAPSLISQSLRPTTTHQCSAGTIILAKNIFVSSQHAPWGTQTNCPLSC